MPTAEQLKNMPLPLKWLVWIIGTVIGLGLPSFFQFWRWIYQNHPLERVWEFLLLPFLITIWWLWAVVVVEKTFEKIHSKAWMLTIPLPIILFVLAKTEEAKNFPFLPEWQFGRFFLYFGFFILAIALWVKILRPLVKPTTANDKPVV